MTLARVGATFDAPIRRFVMKAVLLPALLALAACQNPMLSTNMTFGDNGVSVNPALSGKIGDVNVTVEN